MATGSKTEGKGDDVKGQHRSVVGVTSQPMRMKKQEGKEVRQSHLKGSWPP